jgi:hypothetical protein
MVVDATPAGVVKEVGDVRIISPLETTLVFCGSKAIESSRWTLPRDESETYRDNSDIR